MSSHRHYDITAFERNLRADFEAAPEPQNDFERHQMMGNEVVVQFGVFGARMDNEGVSASDQLNASCAIIASMVENLASDYEGDRAATIMTVLAGVAEFALRGGEVLSMTDAPAVPAGHA